MADPCAGVQGDAEYLKSAIDGTIADINSALDFQRKADAKASEFDSVCKGREDGTPNCREISIALGALQSLAKDNQAKVQRATQALTSYRKSYDQVNGNLYICRQQQAASGQPAPSNPDPSSNSPNPNWWQEGHDRERFYGPPPDAELPPYDPNSIDLRPPNAVGQPGVRGPSRFANDPPLSRITGLGGQGLPNPDDMPKTPPPSDAPIPRITDLRSQGLPNPEDLPKTGKDSLEGALSNPVINGACDWARDQSNPDDLALEQQTIQQIEAAAEKRAAVLKQDWNEIFQEAETELNQAAAALVQHRADPKLRSLLATDQGLYDEHSKEVRDATAGLSKVDSQLALLHKRIATAMQCLQARIAELDPNSGQQAANGGASGSGPDAPVAGADGPGQGSGTGSPGTGSPGTGGPGTGGSGPAPPTPGGQPPTKTATAPPANQPPTKIPANAPPTPPSQSTAATCPYEPAPVCAATRMGNTSVPKVCEHANNADVAKPACILADPDTIALYKKDCEYFGGAFRLLSDREYLALTGLPQYYRLPPGLGGGSAGGLTLASSGYCPPQQPSATHPDVASLAHPDVAVDSPVKPAPPPDVAVDSPVHPAPAPPPDVAVDSPNPPTHHEPAPPSQQASLPNPEPPPAPQPAPPTINGGEPSPPQINVYIPSAPPPEPGPTTVHGPHTPPVAPSPQPAPPPSVSQPPAPPPQPQPPGAGIYSMGCGAPKDGVITCSNSNGQTCTTTSGTCDPRTGQVFPAPPKPPEPKTALPVKPLPPQKAEPTQPKPLPPKTAERAPKPLPPKTVEPEPKPLPPKTVEPEPKPRPLKTVEVQPKPLAPVAAVPQPKPSPAPPAPPQAKPLPA